MNTDAHRCTPAINLAVCIVLVAVLLQGCSLGSGPKSLYPPPAALSQTASLRQDFIQEFLQGRWTTARSLFIQTCDNLLRQDDFCAVARMYVLAYKLHAYLGVTYPHLLDKAVDFSQQGLDCTLKTHDRDALLVGPRDRTMQDLLDRSDWPTIYSYLKKLGDPLFVSVYARKAAGKAASSPDKDSAWANTFLKLAHDVDSRQGWVLFLIQDWKGQRSLEKDPVRQRFMDQRINSLLDLVSPCTQPLIGP
ncbi:hypothetical protein [Desulfoplanes formicivorans]|uniref:Lipoprotein n=1 Tax=Desulfoplanes formicivorans TaxID=1592317 RepID=A0A194AKT4_9BACT|nr:hypothetical protein [Desulfoplanes formicivorans]GAU09319.1 hypothetical protein DPF_2042 [Desulfoplanes formicivorans]